LGNRANLFPGKEDRDEVLRFAAERRKTATRQMQRKIHCKKNEKLRIDTRDATDPCALILKTITKFENEGNHLVTWCTCKKWKRSTENMMLKRLLCFYGLKRVERFSAMKRTSLTYAEKVLLKIERGASVATANAALLFRSVLLLTDARGAMFGITRSQRLANFWQTSM